MVEVPVDKLQLRDDKNLISPPSVASPLYQCAKAITIFDFIPNATLDVQVDSTQVITGAPGGFPMPNGTTVPLPSALVLGQVVRARQNFGGATSNWSAPVTVRDHTIDYPTGPPRPEIEPAPVYKCGSRTGVNNLLTGVLTDNVHLSFAIDKAATLDDFEDGNGIGLNSMGQPNTQFGGLIADEYPFAQNTPGRFNDSFFGNTIGMVAQSKEASGTFRWQLAKQTSLADLEVWIRAADVYNEINAPVITTGFQLGVETTAGVVVWVDSDEVGGIPVPFDRKAYDLDGQHWYTTDKTKTMLKTLRFSGHCLQDPKKKILCRAILVRMNLPQPRALAFDDLQIV